MQENGSADGAALQGYRRGSSDSGMVMTVLPTAWGKDQERTLLSMQSSSSRLLAARAEALRTRPEEPTVMVTTMAVFAAGWVGLGRGATDAQSRSMERQLASTVREMAASLSPRRMEVSAGSVFQSAPALDWTAVGVSGDQRPRSTCRQACRVKVVMGMLLRRARVSAPKQTLAMRPAL